MKARPPPVKGRNLLDPACDRCKKGGFECWEQARGISACHRCGTQRVACRWNGISMKGRKKIDPIVIDGSGSEEHDNDNDEEHDNDEEEEPPRQTKKSTVALKGKGRAKRSGPAPPKRPAPAKAAAPAKRPALGTTLAYRKMSAILNAPTPGPSRMSAPAPAPAILRFAAWDKDISTGELIHIVMYLWVYIVNRARGPDRHGRPLGRCQ